MCSYTVHDLDCCACFQRWVAFHTCCNCFSTLSCRVYIGDAEWVYVRGQRATIVHFNAKVCTPACVNNVTLRTVDRFSGHGTCWAPITIRIDSHCASVYSHVGNWKWKYVGIPQRQSRIIGEVVISNYKCFWITKNLDMCGPRSIEQFGACDGIIETTRCWVLFALWKITKKLLYINSIRSHFFEGLFNCKLVCT